MCFKRWVGGYLADKQGEVMITPGHCIGPNMKIFKILGNLGNYKSSVLSERPESSGEENLKSWYLSISLVLLSLLLSVLSLSFSEFLLRLLSPSSQMLRSKPQKNYGSPHKSTYLQNSSSCKHLISKIQFQQVWYMLNNILL